MANETERYPSRLNKKNRSNSILNMMIGLVFVLILIVAAFIFMDRNENPVQQAESVTISSGSEGQASGGDGGSNSDTDVAAAEDDEEQNDEEKQEDADNEENSTTEEENEEGTVTIEGSVTYEESSDPIVKETVINTGWQPVGTSQKGEHVSEYDPNSIDWKEKIEAITYATGLEESNMHIMMIQNGGSPQKAIGTVTSKDMSEKYRVHLEWVDEKGWKPVKMDILNTIEGAY